MLRNATKCHGDSFYLFWVVKGKPTWGGGAGKITPDPPKLGLKGLWLAKNCLRP